MDLSGDHECLWPESPARMLAADCSCSGGDAASVWRLPGAAPIEDLDLEFSEPTESALWSDLKPRGLCVTFCRARNGIGTRNCSDTS